MQALRAGRQRTHGEYRKADFAQLLGVAVQAPDHDAGNAGGFRLQQHDIADAGLVQAAAVVDHQDFTRLGMLQHLEEDVDAADMPHRTRGSAAFHAGHDGADLGRREADGNSAAQATVCQVRAGQFLELGQCLFIHLSSHGKNCINQQTIPAKPFAWVDKICRLVVLAGM